MRNLIDFENIFVNGIAQDKSIIYSGIQETLLAQTPYMWKCGFMNLASDRATHNDKLKLHKPKWRFMDFWCMRDRVDFEAWLGSEGILADRYSTENARRIKDAVAQMCAICDKVESAKAKGDEIKVVFFCYATATHSGQSAESLCQNAYDYGGFVRGFSAKSFHRNCVLRRP